MCGWNSSLLMIVLHYWHLRGVIFCFVEKVAYYCSVTAGPDAETIVIHKVLSITFGLDEVPRKTWKWLDKVYGRNSSQVAKTAMSFEYPPIFFFLPPPFNQSSHDVAKWRGCLALSKAELGTKLGRQAVWVTMRWVILELRAVRTENPSNYQCKARAHWLSWVGCLP